ncbi:MAG TPA: adenylate/guanylate cyclase domain-containing protein [Gaiellaceae bacterium]|nr:adenylate/guanylate cyclase domain-containing protein [Gaiellaceae bacterium]
MGQPGVRTFLIADVRGYSRFTENYGDEAAARPAAKFAEVVAEQIDAHGGTLVEIRGDEALAVFSSARDAIRAGVDLQGQLGDGRQADLELPLTVGVGVDSGEAVELPDGSFRGAALNVAARLCSRAHGGEVLLSATTVRLAGPVPGLQYVDQGNVRLKNIPAPIHMYKAYPEAGVRSVGWWSSKLSGRPRATLGWRLGALVALIAAGTAAAVVYLTTSDHGEPSSAAPGLATGTGTGEPLTPPAPVTNPSLADLVPAELWKDCRVQAVAEPGAVETAVCLPATGLPDRWEISRYPNGSTLSEAYSAELRRHPSIKRDKGKCNAFVWGGEGAWLHGPGKPGGRVFCYFDGDDAVAVWTHERLGQPTHRDILAIAREGGSDHAGLTSWWRPWHHRIGKAG